MGAVVWVSNRTAHHRDVLPAQIALHVQPFERQATMHHFRALTVAACIAGGMGMSPAVHAQFPDAVAVGTRVRISLPEAHRQSEGPWNRQHLRGSVQAIDGDTLRISIPGAFGAIPVPRSSMRRLEVSRGSSPVASAFDRAAG